MALEIALASEVVGSTLVDVSSTLVDVSCKASHIARLDVSICVSPSSSFSLV